VLHLVSENTKTVHQRQNERFLQGYSHQTTFLADGVSVKVDVNDPSWWEWVTDRDKYGGEPKEDLEHSLGGEGYVIVDQDDVIDGIADFVAHYLVTLPQTEGLPPKELQQCEYCAAL
jgi:hypothetical protein